MYVAINLQSMIIKMADTWQTIERNKDLEQSSALTLIHVWVSFIQVLVAVANGCAGAGVRTRGEESVSNALLTTTRV